MKFHLEEEVEVVEALEEEEEDEGDKTLTRPLWSVITVISYDIFNMNVLS
jgi:hypothetical protein